MLCGFVACRFFAGYRVRPDGIHFVMHADGRPSGMAFVEFDCPQEAMRALVSLPTPCLRRAGAVPSCAHPCCVLSLPYPCYTLLYPCCLVLDPAYVNLDTASSLNCVACFALLVAN